MPRTIINNFRFGETSQNFAGRVDTEVYSQGASRVENMIAMKQGGLKRRPPLKFLLDITKYDIKRIISFTVNADNSYVILISNSGFMFGKWDSDGENKLQLVKSGDGLDSPVVFSFDSASIERFETTGESENNLYLKPINPERIGQLTDDEIKELQCSQYYNSIYFVHKKHPMLRIDYDETNKTFYLWQPRIIVNQDIEYRLKRSEIETGYTITEELGWDKFYSMELNTPTNPDGLCNYPSVISIIGDQMFLANTEAHPDYLWKSRSFGSSQVIDNNSDKSIQDFVQYQLIESDEQSAKDASEIEKSVQYDEEGYPILQYDTNLNPKYRLPRGVKLQNSFIKTEDLNAPYIYGLTINGMYVALQADELEDGFPVYINMSGDRLYNKISTWKKYGDNGVVDEIKYVYGIYEDSSFNYPFAKAILGESGKPLTDRDEEEYDETLSGNQQFETYTVQLYSKYGEVDDEITIESLWTNKRFVDFTFNGIDFKCEYMWNTGMKMQEIGYTDYWQYIPKYSTSTDNLEFRTPAEKSAYHSTDWVISEGEASGDSRPINQKILQNPDPDDPNNNHYYTYTNVKDKTTWYAEYELKKCVGYGWVKTGTETINRLIASIRKYKMYNSLSELLADNQNPVLSFDSGSETLYVIEGKEKEFIIENKLILGVYKYSYKWEDIEKSAFYNLTTKPSTETPKTFKVGDQYYNYTNIIEYPLFTYNQQLHLYTKEAIKYSLFGVVDGHDNTPAFPESERAFYVGTVDNGVSYTATPSTPIMYIPNGNTFSFYYGGEEILRFSRTLVVDSITEEQLYVWACSHADFSVALSNGEFDKLFPVVYNDKIYQYTFGENKDQLFIEGNSYEAVDVSKPSILFNYEKSLTKTATSSTGMQLQLATGRSDGIKWVGSCDRILIGTVNSEWVIPTSINPLEKKSDKYSNFGSDRNFVININTDTAFLNRGNAVRLFYTDYYGLHNIDISNTNSEILSEEIVEIISKQVPNPHIFVLKKDGTIASLCIDRNDEIQAWTRIGVDNYKIVSIAVVENHKTQTLIALCEREQFGQVQRVLCMFDEYEHDEFMDFDCEMVETTDEDYNADKSYYVATIGGYRITDMEDFRKDMEGVVHFHEGTTYYEIEYSDKKTGYKSLVTTNAYEAQQDDGSITIGKYKSINKILIRALDTGRVSVYTSSKNRNTTLYTVSEDKKGVGDFEINISGGSAKDSIITVESVEGDPMTILALAYDVKVKADGR